METNNPMLVTASADGKDITTSRIVAEIFGKNHADVLRDIRELHCSDEFRLSSFALLVEMKKLPQGGASKSEYYEMTRNGFSFLVMGYKGSAAGAFKERFLAEFDKREALLKNDEYIIGRALQLQSERIQELERQLQARAAAASPDMAQMQAQLDRISQQIAGLADAGTRPRRELPAEAQVRPSEKHILLFWASVRGMAEMLKSAYIRTDAFDQKIYIRLYYLYPFYTGHCESTGEVPLSIHELRKRLTDTRYEPYIPSQQSGSHTAMKVAGFGRCYAYRYRQHGPDIFVGDAAVTVG